ncbi:MAG: hypothetical protein FJY88_02525 [Candidatus Eisenbacteria bacterium]|nr:hypothetical protein [Candidatus Eisenbacteria bacterium]
MPSLIDALYASVDEYESGGGRFRADLFEERYRGVLSLFSGLDTDDRLADADRILFQAVSGSEMTRSGLRYLASHLLSIDFEYQANRGRAHRLAYNFCAGRRRERKTDGEFIRAHLVPVLFEPKSLGEAHVLRWLLLEHMAAICNQDPSDAWPDFLPEKQVDRSAPSECLFQMMRRRLLYPGTPLHLRPRTLEQNLRNSGFFRRMAMANPIHDYFLLRLGYVEREGWRESVEHGIEIARKDLRREQAEAAPVRRESGRGSVYTIYTVMSIIGLLAVLVIWNLIHADLAGRMRSDAAAQRGRLSEILREGSR